MGAAVDLNTTAVLSGQTLRLSFISQYDSSYTRCLKHSTKRHQMTAPSCFYNQSLQDNILCLVCGADASLCSDHLIHKAVSRRKDRYECLHSPSHLLSHC